MASDQWKKNPNSLVGRTIVSPRLFIQNLVNWEVESNDLLYVRLLNDTKYSGVNTYEEMEATGDYFGSGLGILPLVRYKDLLTYATTSLPKVDEPSRAFNFSQSQIATLMSYVGDGTFVMSIDPDCGFFSNDVQFLVNIAPPPPPDPTEDDDEE